MGHLRFVLFLCAVLGCESQGVEPTAPPAGDLPPEVFAHAGDHATAHRERGLGTEERSAPGDPGQSSLEIRASGFDLRFLQDRLAITGCSPTSRSLDQVMAQIPPVIGEQAGWTFVLVLVQGERRWRVVAGPDRQGDQQVVEVGQFFQRRFLKHLRLAEGAPVLASRDSGLEIVAWPDRLIWRWHVTPETALAEGSAEMAIGIPAGHVLEPVAGTGSWKLVRTPDQRGFLIRATGTGILATDGPRLMARIPPGPWPAGEERSVGLKLIPLPVVTPEAVAEVLGDAAEPLAVTARQILPEAASLPVAQDGDLDCLVIRQPDTRGRMPVNEAFVRLGLELGNPSDRPRCVRLMLDARREVGMAGMANLLTDAQGTPIGVPMQMTKDWHDNVQDRFMGPWARRLTMVGIPPRSTISLGVTQAYAFWGGVPAASLSHLSCIGYPGNQQHWGQAALGAWEESMTFWPSPPAGGATICDVRAPLARAPGMKEWGWTGNVGGGSWLTYEVAGQAVGLTRVRDHYDPQMPNLASVTYRGISGDSALASRVQATILRSDDYVRVLLDLHVEALRPTTFSRLEWFQMGADRYDYAVWNRLSRGDAGGCAESWHLDPTPAGRRGGRIDGGRLPWFALHGTRENTHGAHARGPCQHDQAIRGLIIRRWDEIIAGRPVPGPTWILREHQGFAPTMRLALVPPEGTTALQAGDRLDAVLEWLVLPSELMTYYGTNAGFAAAHREASASGEGWRLVQREAAGTALQVSATGATVLDTYPVRLRAQADSLTCTLRGGLAWVPLVISGLPGYRDPNLEEFRDGDWRAVDQAVHGRDWWQIRFDPSDRTWEYTVNLPLDGPAPGGRTYRFRIRPWHPRSAPVPR